MYLQKEDVLFKDRKDAGIKLGQSLKERYKADDTIILAVPRGGVETAYYMAEELGTDFTVIISKKLGVPGQEELAFGAMAEDGSVYISERGRKSLDEKTIQEAITNKEKEIHRRVEKYRDGYPVPDLKGKTVIITDDGIATGSTLVPVIMLCRKYGAGKILIAAPVAPAGSLQLLSDADEIHILEQPENFYAVGQFYEQFTNLTDEQVVKFFESSRFRYDHKK